MSSFKLYFSVLSLYFTVPQMWENRMHSSVIFFASFMLLTGLEAGGWLVGFEHCYVKWISDVEYICYVSERFIQKCYPLLTLSKRTIVVPCFSVTKSYHFIQTPVHGVICFTGRSSTVCLLEQVAFSEPMSDLICFHFF